MSKQWIVILTGSLSTDFNHDNLLAQLFALSCFSHIKRGGSPKIRWDFKTTFGSNEVPVIQIWK